MSKAELMDNANRFTKCANARNTLSTRCFGGADPGHNAQAANNRAAALNCLELMSNPNVPPDPGGIGVA